MNRVHTYPITNEAKTKELDIIQDTLYNKECNTNLSISHSKNHKHNKKYKPITPKNKMGHLYILRKRTKEIAKLFKGKNMKIVSRTKKHNTKPSKASPAKR
jgi:hypothetical protein